MERLWNVNPPVTGTGVGFTADVSSFPSCPSASYPQQYATPAVVRAHV
jgi:hypothetical protein